MLHVIGMGYSHPATVIDNKFIEALDIGTSEEWILDKIGIRTRLSTLPLEYIKETRNQDYRKAREVSSMTPTDLGIAASKMALDRAGILPREIGWVVCNCCTPYETVPTESQRLAAALGIRAKSFDVFTACPAFALHIDFVKRFYEAQLPKYILCVSTATLTHKVNYNERSDAAIWGDGAAAWIVSGERLGKLAILDSFYTTDPTRCGSVVVDSYGFFRQDGRAVRDFSVRQTVRLIKDIESRYQVDWNRDVFIGHQANATMLEQITNNRNIPSTNHWQNVSSIGNQAGAGAPATLAMHWDEIRSGQKIIVAVVGAGLSWGSVLMEGRE